MNKTLVRLMSTILVMFMLFCFVGVPVSAACVMSEDEWDNHWETLDQSCVHLSPGSDDSQMNFAWFYDEETEPAVFIKEQGDTDYFVYVGSCTTIDGSSKVTCRVTVTDLLPGTVYEYYCVSSDYTSPVSTFKTADEGSFSAILVSDVHVSESDEDPEEIKNSAMAFNNIISEGYARNNAVSLILSAGDMADQGLFSEYVGVFSNTFTSSIPMATVCGNHDYKAEVYPDVMNYPNVYNDQAIAPDKNGGDYWFVKGDVLFLMLNGNWISADDHRTFVESAVASNPDVKWRVAVMHHDLYGGHIAHRESENVLLRAMFAPIFDEFAVDLVLMGHSHIYSRSHVLYDQAVVTNLKGENSVTDAQGTIYLTTGSTRRPRDTEAQGSTRVAFDYKNASSYIYDVIDFSEDSITFTAYISGEDAPMDEFTLYKTSQQGGHTTESVDVTYDIVFFLSLIAAIFRNLGQLLGI